MTAAALIPVQRIQTHQFAQLQQIGHAKCLFQLGIHARSRTWDAYIFPEFGAQSLNVPDGLLQTFLAALHAALVPHDLAQAFVKEIHGLCPFVRHHLVNT